MTGLLFVSELPRPAADNLGSNSPTTISRGNRGHPWSTAISANLSEVPGGRSQQTIRRFKDAFQQRLVWIPTGGWFVSRYILRFAIIGSRSCKEERKFRSGTSRLVPHPEMDSIAWSQSVRQSANRHIGRKSLSVWQTRGDLADIPFARALSPGTFLAPARSPNPSLAASR
jgi:hypothetical protein